MTPTNVCLRIDIDTVRDAEVLPVLLGMLDTFDIHATFFITTGIDATFRNYRHYGNPLKLLRTNALRQHGIKQMFRGLLYKGQVQQAENVHLVLEGQHELGLHGYHHYDWMNTLQQKDRKEIAEWISKGCELFEDEYGYRPKSFSSPGFATSPQFLDALDDFSFEYSSDFRGTEAFYPRAGTRRCSTLQLPVAERSFGEMEFEGLSEQAIFDRMKRGLDNAKDFFIFYMHPSYEPLLKKKLLTRVLEYITLNGDFKTVTMSQLAGDIKRRGVIEDPSDI